MNKLVFIIGFSICSSSTGHAQQDQKQENIRYREKNLFAPTSKQEAAAFYNEGYKAYHNQDYNKAVELYKKAIALDSNYIDAYDNCGLSYRRLGMLDSAEVYYKKSIRINPKVMIAHVNLALVYTDKGDLDASLNEYNEIKRYNPNDPEAYYGAADIYFRMSNPDKALENSFKALELYKTTKQKYAGDAEYYVGLAYYRKNDKEKAKEYMAQALKDGAKVPEKYVIEFGLK